MIKDATISDCGQYRYTLRRTWDGAMPSGVFVMLNPSTADASQDDPTIRRCIGFARREGWGGFSVVNLFAYRSPSPKVMKAAPYPVGPENDAHIQRTICAASGPVICAWGANGTFKRRDEAFVSLAEGAGVPAFALGFTKSEQPKHPLYLPADAPILGYC